MVFFLLLLSLVLLFLGGEIFVKASSNLAYKIGVSPIVVGLTIVALGTSSPELGVSIKSSLIRNNNIALGNVIGSNIFNFLFILGICSLLNPLRVRYEFIKFDVPVMIFASVLFGLLSIDDNVSLVDGIILLFCAVLYIYFLIKNNKTSEIEKKVVNDSYLKITFLMTIGLSLLVFGSDLLVDNAILISRGFGVSDKIIGLTIVAAGTSLPELVTSLVATIRGDKEIAIGNIIGSNILNIFIIIGISAPLSNQGLILDQSIKLFDLPMMIMTALLAWPLMRSDYLLSRKEGIFLVASYLAYVLYLIKM